MEKLTSKSIQYTKNFIEEIVPFMQELCEKIPEKTPGEFILGDYIISFKQRTDHLTGNDAFSLTMVSESDYRNIEVTGDKGFCFLQKTGDKGEGWSCLISQIDATHTNFINKLVQDLNDIVEKQGIPLKSSLTCLENFKPAPETLKGNVKLTAEKNWGP